MLELRPICENCAKDLPPEAADAMICSFECTFCSACVEDLLLGICPNCGGDFAPRPIRPAQNRRGGNFLGAFPPAVSRRHRPVDPASHRLFAALLSEVPPHQR